MPEKGNQKEEDPRVYFAAERTLLAWVRTGLAMMGFGFVVARFGLFLREIAAGRGLPPTHSHMISLWGGTALVALGVLVNAASAVRYAGVVRRLRTGQGWHPRVSYLGLAAAVILAFIGIGMAVYLLEAGR